MKLDWSLTVQEADDLEAALERGSQCEAEFVYMPATQRTRIALLLHRFQKARVELCQT